MNSASQSKSSLPASRDDAAELVGELERLATASRDRAVGAWFPLILGSVATLASLAVESLDSYDGLRIYWAIAGPCVGAACALYYFHRRVQPADRKSAMAVGWAMLLLFGMLGTVQFLDEPAVDYALAFFVVALLVGLGLLYRHLITTVAGAAGLVVGIAIAIANPDLPDRYTWTALGFGVIGAIAGIVSMLAVER